MEGFLATLDWPSATVWGAFALGTGVAALLGTAGHLQQAYYQWRLERRLARDPYILRDELNEHLANIGGDLQPIEPTRLAATAFAAGALFAGPIWFAEQHLQHLWELGLIALGVGGFLVTWWRWLNDPEADPLVLKLPDGDVPREALVGFVLALGVVAAILIAVIWLF